MEAWGVSYQQFIVSKSQYAEGGGFSPIFMPDILFDFQQALTEWILLNARGALYLDCGFGKTLIELVWAWNIARKTNRRVLLLYPLAVALQVQSEAEKFGLEFHLSRDGSLNGMVIGTNYERLELFRPDDFVAVGCDESSILKNFAGVRRGHITEFMRKMAYRLLATATPAPNDFLELGTSSEALGQLGHMDMLNRFFVNDLNNSAQGRVHGKVIEWRFKGHAEEQFYRYVCSWARAARRPSDVGFSDMVDRDGRKRPFILPKLNEREYVIETENLREGMLFPLPAVGMREQREDRRISIEERCYRVGELVDGRDQSLIWCHLNPEGDIMAKEIPNCVQVSGRDSDDSKEEKFLAFAKGEIRRLVTKPKIGAFGLNFQNCAHQVTFPSNSFEQYYQQVRRSWRFGQSRDVDIDIVMTEGDRAVMENQRRKAVQAEEMFSKLVERMNEQLNIGRGAYGALPEEVPSWL